MQNLQQNKQQTWHDYKSETYYKMDVSKQAITID